MAVAAICAIALGILIFGWITVRRLRAKRRLEANSIEPEALYAQLNANQVLLYDVRQPLDFLAHPEIIPGATRIAPKDIAEQTASQARHDQLKKQIDRDSTKVAVIPVDPDRENGVQITRLNDTPRLGALAGIGAFFVSIWAHGGIILTPELTTTSPVLRQ